MILRLNQSSGIPLYLQLMEQVKHAVETGALKSGDQLPTIRKLAEDLVMNPNTVARAYRELEHEGIIELKHGSGAFISESTAWKTKVSKKAQAVVQSAVERLVASGLSASEIRRLVENELALLGDEQRKLHGADHA
jgi:GntR family transcriptional regulator